MFLGPETSQETLKKPKSRPRSTQRAPKARKKHTIKDKKMPPEYKMPEGGDNILNDFNAFLKRLTLHIFKTSFKQFVKKLCR